MILIFLIVVASSTTIYRMQLNYTVYSQKFKEEAGQLNTIELTMHGTGKQLCDKKACRYFIYVYEPQDMVDNSTVLFTSGFHGNEKIGPTALLYGYKFLKEKTKRRLIFFPVANPSGYNLNQRQTFPSSIDPNRDFPIDNNKKCYLCSSTRILDYLFRNYKIDLTLNFHNGGTQIGWNWGTVTRRKYSHAADYEISSDIGKMLKFYGGKNSRISMKEFKIGTMTQSIYPAEGTFDDWAYAASWDDSVPQSCNNHNYEPYPLNMSNCLMFLFQLGPFKVNANDLGTSDGLNIAPDSSDISNGYISRTLRMLQQLMYVLDPQFSIIYKDNSLYVKLVGCNEVKLEHFSLKLKDQKIMAPQLSMYKKQSDTFTHYYEYNLTGQYSRGFVTYRYTCDQNWQEKGKTIFAQKRTFFVENEEIIFGKDIDYVLEEQSHFYLYLGLFLMLIIVAAVFIIRRRKRQRMMRVKKIIEEHTPETITEIQ